jgi:uncharacterized protein YbcC (UPF0753/DUF2309 family)
MSIANVLPHPAKMSLADSPADERPTFDDSGNLSLIEQVIDGVRAKISPVWPLRDYVAVNPYAGLSEQTFSAAREFPRAVSDFEMLMPVDYYRQQFADGAFDESDIDAAIDELSADGDAGVEQIDVRQVLAWLHEPPQPGSTADPKRPNSTNVHRSLWSPVELLDRQNGTDWCCLVRDEISKHCAAHYDEGQALWKNPRRGLPLYQAWRRAAQHDRTFEFLGVRGFRSRIARLPADPQAAVVALLMELGAPTELWADFLLCEALAMPGWSAWTKYRHREAARGGANNSDFAGLLAMRLAYEAALCEHYQFPLDWESLARQHVARSRPAIAPSTEDLLRLVLLKASEIAFRKTLLTNLARPSDQGRSREVPRGRLAQMVFCIDVRSERMRRQLEATSRDIETFGFAGFFGLPIAYVGLGESEACSQVPVLISPQFKVCEEIDASDVTDTKAATTRRATIRFLRKAWKDFQSSAVSCFAFVETTGLLYGLNLIARSLGGGQTRLGRYDGVAQGDRSRLGPTLRGLSQQGVTTSKQVDMAESVLRGIGITADFARLIVFCGHGSRTENNPLQAGLDCGACGGHSGEPNARFAAKLLNQKYVRQALAERGIPIPEDTHFVAALHNTTTDEIEFFDLHGVPESHQAELQELRRLASTASDRTRTERLSHLPGPNTDDLIRRSRDWSEVRPEWGLAGNAAFIAAPRELTEAFSLDGRSFLHSYDYRNDSGFAVLEQIMTAPMVVAHWINMQYYASTVDPAHFGSGSKTMHNVVGRFGIFSGNGGDLMTGLPWESIHDGRGYRHHPLRLLAVLAAPRAAIDAILARHPAVANLLRGGWLQLIAVEDGRFFRYTEQQAWDEIAIDASSPAAC